ncbi:FHA domain-containing protein [Pseudonocardia sp. 73-21]|mgnify:CR=1 FL=1|uniref:FHA domain-containing protein n=1 Tax=Pseudonocardia sp. 73-21 TaxID=1895809 RepID=UPI0026216D5D|nr:FHA domain-containing protein [Pseudonocardia sp. 73-21]
MAELTGGLACPTCGERYPAGAGFTNCRTHFTVLLPVDDEPAGPVPGQEAAAVIDPVDTSVCDGCGGQRRPGSDECDWCPPVPGAENVHSGPLHLAGPWGSLELGPAPLRIGRSSPDRTVATALADLDTVSRDHAEIVVHDGQAWLRDAGSANGTYLNGRRLVPDTPVQLTPGDTIGLGLSVQICLGEHP